MDYVKMPELLSSEAAKVLANNANAIKEMISSREYDGGCHDNDDCCCPKKVKFIFVLNNVAIVNINAVCKDD
ncbi:MAG: hypothetical protein APF77_09050 [Clostridia bacterium BRH_c25]|nr:MAG: hypothetical protein APF77_09050 [Clostridia bacterium BRH_c25]